MKPKFPQGEEAQQKEKGFYANAAPSEVIERAKELGMTPHSYRNRIADIGGHKAEKPIVIEEPKVEEVKIERIPYPDFKVKPFPVSGGKRDKEDIGLVLTDHHPGRITESYNSKIYIARNDYLLEKVMRVIDLHRPIGTLHIFVLGDMAQGEDIHKGSNVDETEFGVWTQINDYAIPTLSRLILSLLQGVEAVVVDCIWGNHGVYSREATRQANWDNFIYKGLEVALANQKGVTINCPTQFYQLVTIKGWRFFLFHGNQVRSNQGIPLFALRRKLQDWYAYVNGFDYAYCGHWHTWGADQINSRADYQLCPPLVTGDSWALEVVGRASSPVQLCFGIHPKIGRSFEYKLLTDPKFSIYQENEDAV